MSTNDSPPPKPKRRWYQYSLRTLFIFMVLVAVACSWARKQWEARQVLKRVCYFHPDANVEADGDVVALWNFRARERLGDDALKPIGKLTSLRRLDLSGTRITDAGLQHLTGLTDLEELALRETRVSNVGVKKLQQALPNCKIEY